MARDDGLHAAGHVRVGRVLFDERAARQHDVGGVGERRVQHALHDERARSCRPCARRGSSRCRRSSRPGRSRARTAPSRARPSTAALSADRSAGPLGLPTANPRSFAPCTFGASTAGILNFVLAGCGFSRCRQLSVTPPVCPAMLAQHEQLFERRVRGDEELHGRRAAGPGDRVVHGDQRVFPAPRRRVR